MCSFLMLQDIFSLKFFKERLPLLLMISCILVSLQYASDSLADVVFRSFMIAKYEQKMYKVKITKQIIITGFDMLNDLALISLAEKVLMLICISVEPLNDVKCEL
mmetsp:Transcript_4541/g.7260  ORF Transcript_4541/g.7260 Transcript_4541/m.7260 type:complete len:105 (-) Transcript_4541:62-376(-)